MSRYAVKCLSFDMSIEIEEFDSLREACEDAIDITKTIIKSDIPMTYAEFAEVYDMDEDPETRKTLLWSGRRGVETDIKEDDPRYEEIKEFL